MLTDLRHDSRRIITVALRALNRLVTIDDLSRAERVSATRRMIVRFAPLNLVTAVAMCVVYALRFDQPFILMAGIPLGVVVLASMVLFQGLFLPRWRLSADAVDRAVNSYALAIGMGWFILIGAQHRTAQRRPGRHILA